MGGGVGGGGKVTVKRKNQHLLVVRSTNYEIQHLNRAKVKQLLSGSDSEQENRTCNFCPRSPVTLQWLSAMSISVF